jgi:hypothetical protein
MLTPMLTPIRYPTSPAAQAQQRFWPVKLLVKLLVKGAFLDTFFLHF